QTRGSVGGAVVGLAVFTTLRVSKERRKGVVSLMVPLLAMAVFFSLQTVETYVARGESEEGLTTLSNRTVLWQVAYERFLEKPIFGWGLTASRGLFFDAVQLGGAHNAFVNAAVDGGLIGFTAWLISIGVLIYSIRRVWVEKPENHPQLALICGILATLLVNGITMEGIGSGSGASFIWLCLLIGWVQVLRRSPSVILPRSFGQESR
ncbi:MAG TPA: O-antigen ligase family protein, partial [Microthrixaceae bacterium]|nr:O-antigen ligase family protein [Microthrixaceae bacterium]